MAPQKRNPSPPNSAAHSDNLHNFLPSPTDTTTTTPGRWWRSKNIDARTWKGVLHVYFEILISFLITLFRTTLNLSLLTLKQIWRLPKLVLGGGILAAVTCFFFGSVISSGLVSVAEFDVSFGRNYSIATLWEYGIGGERRGFPMPIELYAVPGQVAKDEIPAKRTAEVIVTYSSLTTVLASSSSSKQVVKSSEIKEPTKTKQSEVLFECEPLSPDRLNVKGEGSQSYAAVVQRAFKPNSSNSLVTDPVRPELADSTGTVKSPILAIPKTSKTTSSFNPPPSSSILPGQLPPFRPDSRASLPMLRFTEKYVAYTDIEKFLAEHVTVLTLSATASFETTATGTSTLRMDTTPLAKETPLREL